MNKKLIGNIGLCYASKNMILGTDMISDSMRKNKVHLILLSTKASFNTQKLIQNKAYTYNVKIVMIDEEFEVILKKAIKKNIVVLGIKDNGFKKLILNSI